MRFSGISRCRKWRKIKSSDRYISRYFASFILGNTCLRGIPPSPTPLKSLDWRGVCKNGLQNIERLGVRGQNLDFKELAGFSASSSRTAFALAIIRFLNFRRKGRCHIGLWISLSSSSQRAEGEMGYTPGRKAPNKSKSPPCRKLRDKGGAPFFSAEMC